MAIASDETLINGTGRVRLEDGPYEPGMSALVAHVYADTTIADKDCFAACFILVDGLGEDMSREALHWFASKPGVLVREMDLIAAVEADLPAVVELCRVPTLGLYVAEMAENGFDTELPDGALSAEGWNLFLQARADGEDVPEVVLFEFDDRALARHLLALRAVDAVDRDPGLIDTETGLIAAANIASSAPGPLAERLATRLADVTDALNDDLRLSDRWSVVVPVDIEQRQTKDMITTWEVVASSDVVVGFGLDDVAAARLWREVDAATAMFVRTDRQNGVEWLRDVPGVAVVRRDRDLDWTRVDDGRRRDAAAYDLAVVRLASPLIALAAEAGLAGAGTLTRRSNTR